jgi:hypothetical protein
VERVIRAIMEGTPPDTDASIDDISYVRHLGLIRGTRAPEIANPIYREFLMRRRILEQYGPFSDEKLAETSRRIFRLLGQNGGRM